jgi:hypothetical protein
VTWKRPTKSPSTITAEEFPLLPESLTVRVIRYTVAHRGFRSQSVTLVTTLLDPDIADSDFADLYFRRWNVELHFREIKTYLHMDVLCCLSPAMIERELRMHFIAYNLIRCVMQTAALTHDVDLCRISFKGCLDTLRQFANATAGAEDKPRTVSAIVDDMLMAIARDLLPRRPGRAEPRSKNAALKITVSRQNPDAKWGHCLIEKSVSRILPKLPKLSAIRC